MTDLSLAAKPVSTADAVFLAATAKGAERPDFLRDYLDTVYTIAPIVSLSPDWIVSQSSHETGFFTSAAWARGNPAGIGITDSVDHGYDFATGAAAAKAQMTHLWGYVYGTSVPPLLSTANDPRWEALRSSGRMGSVTTVDDLGNGNWASDPIYPAGLKRHYDALIAPTAPTAPQPVPATGNTKDKPMPITYGRVPMFGYVDKYLVNKREGFGWDNLGKRNPKFVTLHRMVGTMAGTLSHFSNPNVSSMTDFAVAAEVPSGKDMTGIIYRYNDPLGYRSGWASGPVSRPFGDGKAIVDKYGINAVNRDGISIEIDGYDTPLDDEAWRELVHFVAYWADFCKVPWETFPLNPATGISFTIWHTEFTAGTGKECPFGWVRANTDRLIVDVTAFLKPYQTGAVPGETPTPVPVTPPAPKPEYAPPLPVAALAALGKQDADTAAGLVIDGATEFVFVHDQMRAIKTTPRLQQGSMDAPRTGPDIRAGEAFPALWRFKARDGASYLLTEYWTRIRADDTERIRDAA